MVDRWEIIDDHTLKMVLKVAFNPILSKLSREIIPWHLWEGQDLATSSLNYAPVGTGPFKFKNWDKKTNQIELEANPDYFDGRPFLDEMVIKIYPDINQLWAAFMRREVDLVQWITAKDYAVVKKDPSFRAYAVPGSMYYAITYNLDDHVWSDRELREAIAHGINIDGIMKSLPGFEGIKSTGPFHPDSAGYNHEVRPFTFDPVQAKMMLMHRGWQDMRQDAHGGESGIRKKDDRELTLRILVDDRNETYKTMAQIIRQQLAEIGVKLVILLYNDENELTPKYLERQKPQAWLRLFQGLGADVGVASVSWYSSSSEFGKFGNYKNKEIDDLIEKGKSTKDAHKRAEMYQKIHQMIYEDQPACFLFYPAGYFAVNADFRNTDEYFSLYMPTYTMKDWYIEEN